MTEAASRPWPLAAALGVLVLVPLLSQVPSTVRAAFGPVPDTAAHLVLFAIVGGVLHSWTLHRRAHAPAGHRILITLLAVLAVGAADEWLQSWTPGRSTDFRDLTVDCAGGTLGVLLREFARSLSRRRSP